jgi:hypothetical protein
MDFDKLQKEVAALIEPAKPATETAKKMSVADFGLYAQEQVEKAKAEATSGKNDLAKQRLVALKSEVEKIGKFEFKAGELPAVVVYKDPEQLETTEYEVTLQQDISQPDGQSNYTAKSAAFGEFLGKTIAALASNRPADRRTSEEKAEEAFTKTDDAEWPDDLAKCVTKSRRDTDKDYDWGKDAR